MSAVFSSVRQVARATVFLMLANLVSAVVPGLDQTAVVLADTDDDVDDDQFDELDNDDLDEDDLGDDDLDDDDLDEDESGDDDRDDDDLGDDLDDEKLHFGEMTGISPDQFNFDEKGFPARANEVLAIDLDDDDLAIARDLGFTVIERRDLNTLGGAVHRLRVPREFSLSGSIDALEAALPAAPFDYNHIYMMPKGIAVADTAGRTAPLGQTGSGKGINLGVIDAPVDTAHPSLRGQSVTVKDFARAGGRDHAHGTAVVSILVGRDTKEDYSGLIPGARIFAANVFRVGDSGLPSTDSLAMIEALDWLAGQDVGVISISIAGPQSAVVAETIDRVRKRGQVVVAAVGNDGPAAPPLFPASHDGVVGVTAIDFDRRVFRRAGRGEHVDFSAPGVRVRVANADGGYSVISGTSFATPVISALIARRISDRTRASDSVLKRLADNVVDLGPPGKDETYGHGLMVVDDEK